MTTKNGTRAKEGPTRSKVSPADRPNLRERDLDRAIATATLLIEQGRGETVLAQDGKVFLRGAICAGCSKVGDWLVDAVDAWCPSCGGLALVALERAETPFDNGLARLFGNAKVTHLVRPPVGEGVLCLPNVEFGRLRPVLDTDEATCKRCLAVDRGTVFGVYERTIPARQPAEAPEWTI